MTRHFLLPLFMTFALAGCLGDFNMGNPFGGRVPNAPVQPPGIEPLPLPQSSSLTERKPDLCNAARYNGYIGQPGSVVPTLGIDRAYRLVEYRGIEPQNYDPNRIVFRLDASGNISQVDCG